ncbi:hypothetical protein BDZ89DRAFT_1071360 [Hymenopellis radicata]|nr:hypothetical protein BDZ89DRAFT_1071360 [Hymenopellis radicata]
MQLTFALYTLLTLALPLSHASPIAGDYTSNKLSLLRNQRIDRPPTQIQDMPQHQAVLGGPPPYTSHLNDGSLDKPYSSSTPKWSSAGHVAIYEGSVRGRLIGYVSSHRVVSSEEEAATYIYRAHGSGGDLYDIERHERMCIAVGLFGDSLGPGSKNFHIARTTSVTTYPANSLIRDPNAGTSLEITVFSLEPKSDEIFVHWTNSDGTHPVTHIFVHDERIYYTGDIIAVRDYLDLNIDLVAFKWVPTDIL